MSNSSVSSNQAAAGAWANICDRAAALTKLAVAINPAATWESIKHQAGETSHGLKEAAQGQLDALKTRISSLSTRLAQVTLSDVNDYRDGRPATTPANVSSIKARPETLAEHVDGSHERAKALLAALPGMMRDAYWTLGIGATLFIMGTLGVAHPLMMKAMGPNGKPSDIGLAGFAVLFGVGVALASGAINTIFLGEKSRRLSPWQALVVLIAFTFLMARYIASAVGAEYLLMAALPDWANTLVKLIEAVGTGVALMLIEVGAGRCFAFFWRRRCQSKDKPRLEQIISDSEQWNRMREESEIQSRAVKATTNFTVLQAQGARQVSEAIYVELAHHQKVLKQADEGIAVPWTGSAQEHKDISWLRKQVADCAAAVEKLLRLAGLNPPGGPTPPTPTVPPLPPVAPASPNAPATH